MILSLSCTSVHCATRLPFGGQCEAYYLSWHRLTSINQMQVTISTHFILEWNSSTAQMQTRSSVSLLHVRKFGLYKELMIRFNSKVYLLKSHVSRNGAFHHDILAACPAFHKQCILSNRLVFFLIFEILIDVSPCPIPFGKVDAKH